MSCSASDGIKPGLRGHTSGGVRNTGDSVVTYNYEPESRRRAKRPDSYQSHFPPEQMDQPQQGQRKPGGPEQTQSSDRNRVLRPGQPLPGARNPALDQTQSDARNPALDQTQSGSRNPAVRPGQPQPGPRTEIDPLHELVLQARGVQPDVQRITTQQIQALKITTKKESDASVFWLRQLQGCFSGIINAFAAMFHKETKRSSQCDLYGHVVPQGWHGAYPKCEKCGAVVTSPDQLRGSFEKQKPQ